MAMEQLGAALLERVAAVPLSQAPVTCALLASCLGASLLLRVRGVSGAAVACSYDRVVVKREYWRLLLAAVTHEDLAHLALTCLSIWANRELEVYFGSVVFLQRSFVMFVLGNALHVGVLHRACRQGSVLERLRHLPWLGHSGVVFSWMVVHTELPFWLEGDLLPLFGLFPVPVDMSLVVLMVLMETMSSTPCAMSHWCGIVVGCSVVIGAFDWVTPYFAFCLLQWCVVLMLLSKGFPPALESEEVVRQRQAEAAFASRAASARLRAASASSMTAAAREAAAAAAAAAAATAGSADLEAGRSPNQSARARGAARGLAGGLRPRGDTAATTAAATAAAAAARGPSTDNNGDTVDAADAAAADDIMCVEIEVPARLARRGGGGTSGRAREGDGGAAGSATSDPESGTDEGASSGQAAARRTDRPRPRDMV